MYISHVRRTWHFVSPDVCWTGNGTAASAGAAPAAPVLPEEAVQATGEEEEATLWSGDGALFEFVGGWKERGKGEMKVNQFLSAPAGDGGAPGADPGSSSAARLTCHACRNADLI